MESYKITVQQKEQIYVHKKYMYDASLTLNTALVLSHTHHHQHRHITGGHFPEKRPNFWHCSQRRWYFHLLQVIYDGTDLSALPHSLKQGPHTACPYLCLYYLPCSGTSTGQQVEKWQTEFEHSLHIEATLQLIDKVKKNTEINKS